MLPLSVHPTCRADEAHVRNRIQHTAPAACATIVSRACHAAVCRQLLHDLPEQTAWAAASHAAAWRAEAAHEPGLPRRAGHDEKDAATCQIVDDKLSTHVFQKCPVKKRLLIYESVFNEAVSI